MKRITLSLLLLACGDDGTGDATSTTGDATTSMSTSTTTGAETTGTAESGSTSTGMAEGSTSGSVVDVVSCVALPNELAETDCGDAWAVRLCVGDGVCEFTNACECASGDPQVELRTASSLEIRSVGEWTIPDCGAAEPIDGMGTGCTDLPADTALAFTIDDGVGNQIVLEVRKTGTDPGVWRLLAFTPQ
jgi:hypothetical protein